MSKTKTPKRSYKLDIMTVLEAADRNMVDFYDNLTEEEQKAFAPSVIMRWMSAVGNNNPQQQYNIMAVNDLVNIGLWNLNKHPELVWKLLAISGTGKKQYHQWIPRGKETDKSPKLEHLIEQYWPHSNTQEKNMIKALRTEQEWLEFASDCGMDDGFLKELRNEFKKNQD